MLRNFPASAGRERRTTLNLAEKRLFLLDLDGTLYLGEQLFPGAAEFLRCVRAFGGTYLFLTNNSSRGPEAGVAKLRRLGVPAEASDFLTSADALVDDLRRTKSPSDGYYVCGTESLKAQLRGAGLRIFETPEAGVTTLVCGFDTELTFQKLEDACILLTRGADFIATHPDWVCPTQYGYVPDCGSVCQMLTRATGRRPRFIGKPQPAMVRLAMARTGIPASRTLVVGDRLYTDIACGVNAGVDAALVLSGEADEEALRASQVKPAAVYRDIAALLEALRTAHGG